MLPPDLDMRTLFDAVYYGPTMPWIDPRKEAEGWEMMIAANVATEADWTRARGRNPAEVKRQRKREVDYNRENNMVTANDPDPSLGDPNSEKDPNSISNAKRNAAKRSAERARRNAEPE